MNGTQRCRLKAGGDCAASNSQSAIESPVFRAKGVGACLRCTAPKADWGKRGVIEKARRRNFAYQVTANHRRLGPLLGGAFSDRVFKCPECGVLVDEELERQTLQKYENASEKEQADMQRAFAVKHAAGYQTSCMHFRICRW